MSLLSIFPLLMAAVCFYTALYHLFLYLKQRQEMANLAFAFLSIIVCIYAVFCSGLYNSSSIEQGIFWQRLQLSITNFIGISLGWFIYYLLDKRFKKYFIIMTGIYLVLFFLSFFIRNDLTLSINNPAIKNLSIFNYKFTYYEATPGIIFIIEFLIQILSYFLFLFVLIKMNKSAYNKYTRPIIVALVVFFFFIMNDIMVSSKIYVFIYTVEYAFLILIISVAVSLLNKFVDLKESLALRVYTDPLTGQPNREKLIIDIENVNNPLVLLINIDSFKEINDFYGNKAGDYVLLEMSARLKMLSFGYDYHIYKMHGDEFAILMDTPLDSTYSGRKSVGYIVQYLFEMINDNVFKFENYEINIRVTIGVADYSCIEKDSSKNKIINNADMVLKEAKKIKKSFLVYDESMEINKEYENHILWADKLKKALKDDRITVYYQPIINNRNGKINTYECLVRMIDTDGKIIGPYSFLDISQKIRLYSQITSTVIKKAFTIFKDAPVEFSINLTVKDILSQDTSRLIKHMLEQNPDIASRTVFEITESEGIFNFDVMIDFIRDVKALGCKIAIDDFGTGYSNFEYIVKLNVDYIKIDASIIKNLDKDRNSYIIAKMIVNAAKELGILTIAEFVHSKEVQEKCLELGIDFSQGFYFSEPKEFIK